MNTKQIIFIDPGGDHVWGIEGIAKLNDFVYLLDNNGRSFGKLMVNAKYSKKALNAMQKCSFWHVCRCAFHRKLMEIRTRHIYFYWLEQSQKRKLMEMIREDYASLQNECYE